MQRVQAGRGRRRGGTSAPYGPAKICELSSFGSGPNCGLAGGGGTIGSTGPNMVFIGASGGASGAGGASLGGGATPTMIGS